MAQPALGVQIRNLEQELGVELLRRHARGVVPTRAGEVLARCAESLLREFSRIRQEMMDFGTVPSGRVTLGLTSSVGQRVVAGFVQRCRQKYPEIRLVFIGPCEVRTDWQSHPRRNRPGLLFAPRITMRSSARLSSTMNWFSSIKEVTR